MKATEKVKLPVGKGIWGAWQRAARDLSTDSACGNGAGGPCTHGEGEHNGACCRRHAVVLAGYGKRDFPFPTTDELVSLVISYFNALAHEYEKRGKQLIIGDPEGESQADETEEFFSFVFSHLRQNTPAAIRRRRIFREQARRQTRRGTSIHGLNLPKIPVNKLVPEMDGFTMTETSGPVLRIAAGTLAKIMHEGRFKAVIARQFDPFKGAVNWAMHNMPKKYFEAASSLNDQLLKLEEIYTESLPRIIQFLGAQYPNASEQELLDAAVSMLNEQLTEILFVLSIWTDSFAQQRDGMYKQLEYVRFMVEQAFHLFRTGDITGACGTDECQDKIKTHAYHVGDVFMPRFSDQGPATIPGTRGPVGAHIIEVPFDEADLPVLWDPLYGHEWRHDCAADIEGLLDNMIESVVTAIKAADAAGKFKFSRDKIQLGKQSIRMIDIITQAYAQTLGETDADIAGGVMLTGEAYMYSMLATFGAFNMRGSDALSINRLLRAESYFAIGDQGELGFEPHMPDFIRLHIVAAALDRIGFTAEAKECRKLTDQAAGLPLPTNITWHNVDPKSRFKFKIEIPIEDLKQVAPVVVDAIINAPLEALGGLSTANMVNWNRHRQDKVDALVRSLINGKSDIPWEMGDFFASYVSAACIKAAWTLWKSGQLPPVTAAYFVEKNAQLMMDQVKVKFEARQAEKAAAIAAAQSVATPAPAASETDASGAGDAKQK